MSTRQQSGGPPRGAVQSPMATRPDGANFDPKQQQKYDTQASATGVSLCQVVALTMVYRRLSVVAGSVPFLCVAIPIFIKILLLSVNSFTQDYGLATLILTTFLVLLWYQIIRVTAPNPEKEKEAYQKSHLRVPFVMFGFSYWFIRAVLWIGNKGQFDDRRAAQSGSLQFVPTFAWSVGARPACIFGVLGLAVITRYIGPFSVVRCSTMPLVSNHYYQILTSWEGFVVSLASPSGNAANGDISLGSITYRLHQVGRRYQSPPLLNSFLLVVATASLGAFVGHIVMPYWEMVQPGQHDSHATQSAWFLIYFTTALTVIFHLGLSLRGQHSHELNPKRYYEHNNKRGSLPVVSLFFEKIWSIGASTVVVPAISFFSASIYNGDYQHYGKLELAAMIFKELGVLLILCVTTAACVGFYTAGINEAVKHVLCTPGSRLQRFVREVTCGRAPNSPDGGESSITYEQEDAYVVDAMLHSLLHRELALVTQISKSTASGNPNYIKLEEYEAERNEQAITAVAKSLLTTTKDSCEAPLEEDILRHSILESLGGSKLNSSSSPAAVSPGMSNGVFEEFPVDMHHQETIQYWIQPPSNTINLQRRTNATATSVEPKGVPLVRALCAFSGGLGQALIDCSKPQSPYISWEFPPGAIAAAEYATVALARCIAYNLKHSNQNAADWRSTHISMFIPAALTSAYRLHLGILEFAQYRIKVKRSWNLGPDKMQQRQMMGYDRSAMDTGAIIDEIARETPELMKILRACNASVKIIRRELLASQGSGQSMRIIENSVGKDCACWVQQIMSQQH